MRWGLGGLGGWNFRICFALLGFQDPFAWPGGPCRLQKDSEFEVSWVPCRCFHSTGLGLRVLGDRV